MDYRIDRITEQNYPKFDDMLFWRENGTERVTPSQEVTADVRKDLQNQNLYVYAAEVEGRYVGWISLVYIPKVSKWKGHGHVYVDELWVAPEYRGHGFAKVLMKKAEELKTKLAAVGVRLYVNVENPEAKALYETCGYQNEGQAIFMAK